MKSRSDRKMDLLFAWHIWHKCKTWMENERNVHCTKMNGNENPWDSNDHFDHMSQGFCCYQVFAGYPVAAAGMLPCF